MSKKKRANLNYFEFRDHEIGKKRFYCAIKHKHDKD